MVKLLLCMFSAVVLAALLLQLRQQRLEVNYQCNQFHNKIEKAQIKLWNQQLDIAVYTAPNAIAETVKNHDLNLVPDRPVTGSSGDWLDAAHSADAAE